MLPNMLPGGQGIFVVNGLGGVNEALHVQQTGAAHTAYITLIL